MENLYSVKEFANKIGGKYKSVLSWIRLNPWFVKDYCITVKGRGRSGQNYKVKESGLGHYIVRKQGSRNSVNFQLDKNLDIAKGNIVNLATSAVRTPTLPAQYINDPIIALRISQIDLQKEIQNVKEENKKLTQRVMQIQLEREEAESLTSPQRQRLNDRIRALAFHIAPSSGAVGPWCSMLWGRLNKCVGRSSIDNYRFEDYKKAIEAMKAYYVEYGLDW